MATVRRFAHPSSSSTTKVCVYFQSNNCRYGDACRFSHQTDSIVQVENGHVEPDVPPQHTDRPTGGCRFWLNGQHCKFGDSCRYEHKPEEFGSAGGQPAKQASWSGPAVRDTSPIQGLGQARKASTQWVQTRPRLGSVDDMNWRVRQPTITEVMTTTPTTPTTPHHTANKPCKFWAQNGTCKFGDKCRFAHERQTNDASSTVEKPVITSASLLHKEFRREHRPTFSSTSWDDIMDADDGGLTPDQMSALLNEWNGGQDAVE